MIPFGAEIQYKPIADKDVARLHKFGEKVLSGIFVGYHQKQSGSWSGDLFIADWEAIENAESSRNIYIKRFNAKEVFVVKINGRFRFPLVEGDLRQPGEVSRVKKEA